MSGAAGARETDPSRSPILLLDRRVAGVDAGETAVESCRLTPSADQEPSTRECGHRDRTSGDHFGPHSPVARCEGVPEAPGIVRCAILTTPCPNGFETALGPDRRAEGRSGPPDLARRALTRRDRPPAHQRCLSSG